MKKDKEDKASESTSSESENSLKNEKLTERGTWDKSWEFVFFLISFAVGVGNIWRFPYLCMRNGGGAFLIPYFTFTFLCGVPIFYLELIVGQFSSLSALQVWKICPLAKGLGWGMMIVSTYRSVYYIPTVVTWVLYYLGSSFTSHLPWSDCNNTWNTDSCYKRSATHIIREMVRATQNSSLHVDNSSFHVDNGYSIQNQSRQLPNHTDVLNSTAITFKSPSEEFWEYNCLQKSSGIEDSGGLRLELVGCLALCWVLIFFCVAKGIKTSGKVVYVTSICPYVLLIILLVRGSLLPGSINGIKYYITPDFNRLLEMNTWCEACLQIFFSLGTSWGTMITMASYNKFSHNCLRDSLIIPVINSGTSFFAGFVIFSIMGFLAHEAGIDVSEVVNSGPGLAFITYPAALALMPWSVAWAIIFFIMLLFIGLGSQIGNVETVISGIVDTYPRWRRWKPLITGLFCILGLLGGLPFMTRAGVYHFQIWDWYSAAFAVCIFGFLECVVFAWVYGWRRLSDDIEMMLGHRPCVVWRVLWCFVTPSLLFLVILYATSGKLAEPVIGTYVFPRWAIALGWIIAISSIIPLPVMAAVELYKQEGSFKERIFKAAQPATDWGPSLDKHKAIYNQADSMDGSSLDGSVVTKSEEMQALALNT